MAVPTMHIAAKADEIAKTVLMPGDPLRSEYIAKHYLENPKLVNDIRGVHGYTGTYKGKPVTVMASGMGQPSIGIYSYELFKFYDVDAIIRVGSCGAFHPDLHVRDIVIAMGACTNGSFASQFNMPGTFAPIADFDLVRRAADLCREKGVHYKVGNIFSSDMFYNAAGTDMEWAKMGVLGVEMESAALYCNAAWTGKKALCICTVSDNFLHPEENATAEERQNSFTDMMEIALGLV
ncbi:MAG: purine-nucleoside phosphorylase [Ruminococcaceae bacterium]|nr:purine-nucleoside phosphorylase [Oscillospiraceae bacterium]